MAQDELTQAVHIDGRLWFCPLRTASGLRTSQIAQSCICYCIDESLVYQPFFADFGPLNLGSTYRFCKQTQELLQEADRSNRRVYYYCGPHAQNRANAAVLVGIYQVIFLNKTADEAFKPLQAFKPYVPFRDASCGVSTFHLTVFDVIKGVQKARDVGFLDWNSGSSNWSLEEYEHYEQVENGDLNWIVPGKLVAFSGPANRGNEIAGYRLHTPEDYWDFYRKKSVTAVVRLNKKVYDRQRFIAGGFRHYDLYFPDGSCPSEAILLKWLEIAESEPGALAVHCKAGLGRTGVLICCYIMKHFKFTAEEVIGYIRVCRPGSVIGPQQNFLRDVEARMWHEGDMWRATRGINKPHLALGDLVVNGKPVPTSLLSSLPSDTLPSPSTASLMNNYGRSKTSTPANQPTSPSSITAANNGSAGTGPGMLLTRLSGGSLPLQLTGAGVGGAQLGGGGGGYVSMAAAAAGAADAAAAMAQYRQIGGQQVSASLGLAGFSGLTVQVPPPSLSYAGSSLTPPASSSSTPTSASNRYMGRSITPLRYATHGMGMGNGGGSMLGSASGGSIIAGGGYTGRASYQSMAAVTRSSPSVPLQRAPSADRAAERLTLRSTLHTDTLRAADRLHSADPRHVPTSLSADMSLLGVSRASGGVPEGVMGVSAPIPTTPKPSAPGHRPNAGVARTLAPNGQPRKIPIAMLPQYHAGMASKPAAAVVAGVHVSAAGTPMSPSTPLTQVMAGRGGGADFGRAKTAAQMRYSLQSK